jgi:hypothetical protein
MLVRCPQLSCQRCRAGGFVLGRPIRLLVHHLLEKSWCRLLVGRDVITMREWAPEWVAFDDPHGFYRLMNGGTRGR